MEGKQRGVETVFAAAGQLETAAARAEYLDEACGSDGALRVEVEELLKAHDEAGVFLQPPPREMDGRSDVPLSEQPGTVIDRYKLLQQIGEGGFGVVYLAEQQEPIRRKVALKIIKLGMDTKEVIGRFEAERQALAMMDHPNIAKVLDAGATSTGRPYFVMELVQGVPVTEYCDTSNLTTRERLGLFRAICSAVQHAHQKGIIHRDIKPTNVLVTLRDGKPVPKVIDFGVAKATEHRLTERTLFTEFHQFVGTPEYMSPEQAEMSGLDVDTRSDIYSLGVLLYELLTGTTPFRASDLRRKGYDEIGRAIRETEPDRPSTRLETLGEELAEIAKHRQIDPAALGRLVRGDLDWIVMKSLEKDRARRYETVSDLAADIQRHLNDEPVVAGPPSAGYRLRKFVRRNRTTVLAGSLVAASLVVGMVISTIGFVTADHQRKVARQAQRDSETARQREAEQRGRVELRERANRRLLYAAHMNLAMHAWQDGNAPVVRQLLDRHCPTSGGEDLRHFEWYYLWRASQIQDVKITRGQVQTMAFSRDGKALVTWGMGGLTRRDPGTGRPMGKFRGSSGVVIHIAFLPDGRTLATVANDRTVKLWDLDTLSEGATVRLAGQRGPVHFAAVNSAGTMVAVGGKGPVIGVYDLADGKERLALRSSLKGEGMGLHCVAFSPDGKTLITGGGGFFDKSEVKLWDLHTGLEKIALKGHTGLVHAAVFTPDGKTVITSSTDATIRLWDPTSGQGKACLRGHTHDVHALALTSNGEILASAASDLTVRLWNVRTAECLATLGGHGGEVWQVAIAPDGNALISAGRPGRVKVARLWDLSDGLGAPVLRGHLDEVRRAAFSPDGTTVATGSLDSTIKLWDVATNRELKALRGHRDKTQDLAFSPDGKMLATSSLDRTVRLWDLATGRSTVLLDGQHVASIAFSPDSKLLAMGMGHWRKLAPSKIIIWNVRSGKQESSLTGHLNPVETVTFSPDGTMLASGAWHGGVKLWGIATGEEITHLRAHRAHVTTVRFSPDGKVLATASWDRTVKLWDVATGQSLRVLTGHRASVSGAVFSPDGQTLATAGWDGLVKFWDVATGQERATLRAHTRPVWTVAFSPDGRTLATGSRDGTAKLWRGATDKQVAFGRLWAQAMNIAAAEPQAQSRIVANLKAHLAATVPKGLAQIDIDMAGAAAVGLERAGRDDLAAEAYRDLGAIIARDKDKTLADQAGPFLGNAHRLGLVGKPMPLEGTTMEGKPFDWTPCRGKTVLVYFWTSTCDSGEMCPPCQAELANIQRYYELYHERGFDVVGVNGDDRGDAVAAFLRQQPLPWVTLHVADPQTRQRMTNRYGVKKRTAFLIGKDGKVVSIRAGGKELGRLLAELLGPQDAADEGQ